MMRMKLLTKCADLYLPVTGVNVFIIDKLFSSAAECSTVELLWRRAVKLQN